jgi:hypothetical protein
MRLGLGLLVVSLSIATGLQVGCGGDEERYGFVAAYTPPAPPTLTGEWVLVAAHASDPLALPQVDAELSVGEGSSLFGSVLIDDESYRVLLDTRYGVSFDHRGEWELEPAAYFAAVAERAAVDRMESWIGRRFMVTPLSFSADSYSKASESPNRAAYNAPTRKLYLSWNHGNFRSIRWTIPGISDESEIHTVWEKQR